jgi:ABC-type multidrug transport system fused ATPase/permease subunit
VHFPAGAITMIVGSATSGPSELLSLLWGQGSKSPLRLQGGKLLIQGRETREWSLSALRERITYLRDNEAELNLPAGMHARLFIAAPFLQF